MHKQNLIELIRESLRAELANTQRQARETAAAANHPEAKPENDKDTRKIELSYLAAGQAARAQELEASLVLLSAVSTQALAPSAPIQAGALVHLDVEGKPQCVLLSPAGGGLKLVVAGTQVVVVTAQSPLGAALLGRISGESFELVVAGQRREIEVLSVE